MRRRWTQEEAETQPEVCVASKLVDDLEERGVAPSFATSVAVHLAEGEELRGRRREAVLEGVTAAYTAHRLDCEALEQRARTIDEIQRLMGGFAGELRKLEEGLRVVSAYVLRMHDKASREVSKRLH
jgi:hypothetical protein